MKDTDRELERLVRESRLAAVARAGVQAARVAWQESWTWRVVGTAAAIWNQISEVDSIRFKSEAVVVACVTTLVFQTLESGPQKSLGWVLPAACAAGACATWALADPLARARRHRRG